ncbi:hypothetical protein [Catenulispora pinisilvae]|uniref:hypothetical protein n=1 Tax=Catenulispora pinisilvae TaxID=2705253 RepID=UPI0018926FFA|nr:hypothetical protein [Catenulispora pinisilvae]
MSVPYEVVCASGNDAAKLPLLKSLLSFLSSPAEQVKLSVEGLSGLPDSVRTQVTSAVAGLK